MRSTLMMRMMVGLMGSEALTSISSSVMPMMESSTMARSSWFHLESPGHNSLSWGRRTDGAGAVQFGRAGLGRFPEISSPRLPILQGVAGTMLRSRDQIVAQDLSLGVPAVHLHCFALLSSRLCAKHHLKDLMNGNTLSHSAIVGTIVIFHFYRRGNQGTEK